MHPWTDRRSRRHAAAEKVGTSLGVAVVALGLAFIALVVVAQVDAFRAGRSSAAADSDGSPRVLVVGDSYSAGYGSSDPASDAWPIIAADDLGWDATVDAVLGSGYTTSGGPSPLAAPFGQRLLRHEAEDFDLIVLQGSQNDAYADPRLVAAAVEETLDEARELWPDARVVAMGPSAPEPAAREFASVSETIRLAVEAEDVPYIDAAGQGWFTAANSADMTGPDAKHLNARGYAYLAGKFAAALRQLDEEPSREDLDG